MGTTQEFNVMEDHNSKDLETNETHQIRYIFKESSYSNNIIIRGMDQTDFNKDILLNPTEKKQLNYNKPWRKITKRYL